MRRLCTHISTNVFVYTAGCRTGASWRERKCPNFETVKRGFEPATGVLLITSRAILPLSHRAIHIKLGFHRYGCGMRKRTINSLTPQVSRGRALKSFRMLLDRRQRVVNDLCILQTLSILGVLCFPS